MTYEEAIKMRQDILKKAIKTRLYYRNSEKFEHFKPSKNHISLDEILKVHEMIRIIHGHEHGKLFKISDTFFDRIKNKK